MAATRLVRAFGGARRVFMVLAITAVCGLIAVAAYAAIPDSTGTFNGCVSKLTGVLRVIDPPKGGTCATGRGLLQETPITWSQRGPQGPPGPPGPSGGITSLDQLTGLPCNVNSPAGRGSVRLEYDAPIYGSAIHLYCQTEQLFLFVHISDFEISTPGGYHSFSGHVTADPPSATVCDYYYGAQPCPPISYKVGTVVTLTAVPNADAHFQSWGGACTGTLPTCTITMEKNTTVYANFDRA